jgi:hypothetical protein
MPKSGDMGGKSPSEMIDQRIAELDDWRGETLAKVRKLIRQAVPGVVEDWKWWIPVWTSNGIICTGETYKASVKLTFPKGSSLRDSKRLFNPKFTSGVRRSIDISKDTKLDAAALKALVRAAAALNAKGKKK